MSGNSYSVWLRSVREREDQAVRGLPDKTVIPPLRLEPSSGSPRGSCHAGWRDLSRGLPLPIQRSGARSDHACISSQGSSRPQDDPLPTSFAGFLESNPLFQMAPSMRRRHATATARSIRNSIPESTGNPNHSASRRRPNTTIQQATGHIMRRIKRLIRPSQDRLRLSSALLVTPYAIGPPPTWKGSSPDHHVTRPLPTKARGSRSNMVQRCLSLDGTTI